MKFPAVPAAVLHHSAIVRNRDGAYIVDAPALNAVHTFLDELAAVPDLGWYMLSLVDRYRYRCARNIARRIINNNVTIDQCEMVQISEAQARRLYNDGKPVRFAPASRNPYAAYARNGIEASKDQTGETFDEVVQEFRAWNGNLVSGYQIGFYREA